ncbi:hypothetical protein [Cupriavidus basilensis]|uniref:hypothetical protein n=1 Tax=Cupriavidus basilensis TaxID=68895 RepID=UPI0039F73519
MRRDIMVCAVRAGWILKTCGAATAILEFEDKDEAIHIGQSLASRYDVNFVIEEPCGMLQFTQALELAA